MEKSNLLGKIKNVQLKDIWNNDLSDFTTWLSENLEKIESSVGLDLEYRAKDISVGTFSVDILARDVATDKYVIIVNQFEETNYDHLGKFITYASVLDASSVIWIASDFNEEHKKALDWLNDNISNKINFYGIKVELFQIDDSKPAVSFNVISRPNSLVRLAKQGEFIETKKRLTNKEIEANELQRSLDKANATIRFDLDGKILSTNKLFCDLMECEPDDLIKKDYSVLVSNEELDNTYKEYWKELRKGNYQEGKFVTKTKNGKEKWIEAKFFPIFDKEDKLVFILKIANDITKEVQRQKNIEEARLKAEQALVAKDNFLSNMSHEIRTPLNAIIGFSDLLIKEKLNDTQIEHVNIILNAGENLLSIINEILDLSKIESGKFLLEKSPFCPTKVLNAVDKMLRNNATKKGVTLETLIDDSVPDLILGDEFRLSQIVINLVNNAIKFTNEGSVKVFATADLLDKDNCTLKIKVQDTGIGIPEDKQQMIFERFAQANTDTSRKFGGSGLGLNIVKLLVENFKGNLSLESEPGKGSVFSVSIPFKIDHETENVKQEKEEVIPDDHFIPGKILLFEDNLLNKKLGERIISDLGYNLTIVSDGVEGLEWLKENKADLILMDLRMPEMDGYEATSIIRKELKLDIPIIAISAHSLNQEKAKCLEYGMNDFISKPFKLDDLSNKIKIALNGSKTLNHIPYKLDEYNSDKLYDLKELELLASGNKEFIKEMSGVFIKETPSELRTIQNSLLNNDHDTIFKVGHKLKSSYDLIGYKNVHLLKNIVEMGKNAESVENISSVFERLKSETSNIIEDLKEEFN